MSRPPDISVEVASFLSDSLASYEQLDVLLLLRERQREEFTASSVAEALHMSEASAEEALDHLHRENLLQVRASGGNIFKYGPKSPDSARAIDRLADDWNRNRVTVMNLMSSNAIERVRTKALRTFADAFLLGRKKSDG